MLLKQNSLNTYTYIKNSMNPAIHNDLPAQTAVQEGQAWIRESVKAIIQDPEIGANLIRVFDEAVAKIPSEVRKLDFINTAIQRILFAIWSDVHRAHSDDELDAALEATPATSRGFFELAKKNMRFID